MKIKEARPPLPIIESDCNTLLYQWRDYDAKPDNSLLIRLLLANQGLEQSIGHED